jgi:hypothetical protein
MSSEILKSSLRAARELLAQTQSLITVSKDGHLDAPDLDMLVADATLAERIITKLAEIDAALCTPEKPDSQPLSPTLVDVDLDVIARSCDWSIDQHGNLFGLTREHGHYEFTGIVLDGESLAAWKRGYIDPLKLIATRGKVQTAEEALVIARENEQKLRWELNMWKHGFHKANMNEQATQIDEFLSSVPLIPKVLSSTTPPREVGPWSFGQTSEKPRCRHFIESDDGTHDVRLYLDGDFASDESRTAYGEMIAEKLNSAFQSLPRPRRRLCDEINEGFDALAAERVNVAPAPVFTAQLQAIRTLMHKRLTASPDQYTRVDDCNAMRYVHDLTTNLLGVQRRIVSSDIRRAAAKGLS